MKHQPPKAMRWLEELMFGTFDVRTVVINVVSNLLRPFVFNGYGVIELHEAKRDGTCKTSHNRVSYFGDDCIKVKERKG